MKSFHKLIRRFFFLMLTGFLLMAALNITIFCLYFLRQTPNSSPWKTASETAQALTVTQDGYHLPEEISQNLKANHIWAMLISDDTGSIVWQTENLPDSIPRRYNLSAVASLTRGYLDDCPTFTGERSDGLLVLGYPPKSFWKHMWPSWDYDLIAEAPQILLFAAASNVLLIFIIYFLANTTLLRSVRPIIDGIQDLSTEKEIYIPEKGILSEIAANINRTSETLKVKNRLLQKKETARANWISGISHDIRTPLSMVMGYAGQLEQDPHLTEEERKKISVIRRQSERMKNLVNDLNLSSKLEYHMQPLHCRSENLVSLVRQVVVDFINMDIENRYPIEWLTSDTLPAAVIRADQDLVKRAFSNIIQNSINHNPAGCRIYVCITRSSENYLVQIEDDGAGAEDDKINSLNHAPHYMFCDEQIVGQRHGLGLLIVKQIAAAHKGSASVSRSTYGGFAVTLSFPAAVTHRDGDSSPLKHKP